LFDGDTGFGWKGARVENGRLLAGSTTAQFGNCQFRAAYDGSGIVTVGGKEYPVEGSGTLAIRETGGRGPVRVEGTSLRGVAIRPLHMKKLFDGRDLKGWRPIQNSNRAALARPIWTMRGNALRVEGGPASLEFEGEMFGDVAVQADVRTRSVHSNGGLFFRCVPGEFIQGYEAQIHNRCIDNNPAHPFRYCTGGIDDRQDARRLVSRDFETFRLTVVAVGRQVSTWVNGVQVTDWNDGREPDANPRKGSRIEPGTIQIQAHDPATDYEVHRVLAVPWD
jgi:hypothetical protein